MKKFVLLISVAAMALLGSSKVSAQGKYGPDSTECIKYLSYYTEYYKQKNYDAALPNWRQAYKYCPPTARYTMLSDGTTLLRNLIQKNQNNPVNKQQLVDSLMTVYNQRVQYWPKYATGSLNNMALDMYNYMKDEPAKLLEGLTDVIAQTKEQTRPNIFLFQINTAVDLYKKGMLDPETVINIYETGVQYLGQVKPKNDVEARSIEKTQTDFESIFITSQVASCDNLIALFTPRYEADPQNLDLSKNIVRMMSTTEGCMDNDLFLNAVQSVYNMEPSANAAYNLYKLYSSRSDFDNAVKYLEEAIMSEGSDDAADAGYYYELATFCFKNGKNAKAYEAANKAAELDRETWAGKAYMLIGTMWASVKSNGDYVESRAPYCIAVDYMIKAKNADSSLTEEANRLINTYSAYFPVASEAFMYGWDADKVYTISAGGLTASTKVRTQQ